MIVLGIESTCDETAASIVKDGREILSQVISSQVDLHNIYGGVVPELACRRHIETIIPVIDQAVQESGLDLDAVDLIAVANGPGLIGPLYIGVNTAKGLSMALGKPLVGVNHVEAHLYAALMSSLEPLKFPLLGVVVSGGHTDLVKIHAPRNYQLLGKTVDDAIGEAFDKVAKLLGLPYPGGPYVESLALQGNPKHFSFKAGKCKNNPYNFSFSGLKTAVLYALKDGEESGNGNTPFFRADLCASFQHTAFKDVLEKTNLAAKKEEISTVIFGGGVTNSQKLKEMFAEGYPHLKGIWPEKNLSLDNATMIAGLGYHVYLDSGGDDIAVLEAKTRIAF
jgi:N6-L-threonylcarbamoyladenine synthase